MLAPLRVAAPPAGGGCGQRLAAWAPSSRGCSSLLGAWGAEAAPQHVTARSTHPCLPAIFSCRLPARRCARGVQRGGPAAQGIPRRGGPPDQQAGFGVLLGFCRWHQWHAAAAGAGAVQSGPPLPPTRGSTHTPTAPACTCCAGPRRQRRPFLKSTSGCMRLPTPRPRWARAWSSPRAAPSWRRRPPAWRRWVGWGGGGGGLGVMVVVVCGRGCGRAVPAAAHVRLVSQHDCALCPAALPPQELAEFRQESTELKNQAGFLFYFLLFGARCRLAWHRLWLRPAAGRMFPHAWPWFCPVNRVCAPAVASAGGDDSAAGGAGARAGGAAGGEGKRALLYANFLLLLLLPLPLLPLLPRRRCCCCRRRSCRRPPAPQRLLLPAGPPAGGAAAQRGGGAAGAGGEVRRQGD